MLRFPHRIVEIVGLRRWTATMIQDSMNVYAPGESLQSHGCAATLRYNLRFAEAASFETKDPASGIPYNMVLVIEPQDSALVRHRPMTRDTSGTKVPWAPLVRWARTRSRVFDVAVRARVVARGKNKPPVIPAGALADSVTLRALWRYLDAHTTRAASASARRLLAESPYFYDRLAAVAILSSFDGDDAAWHALTNTLLEPEWDPRMLAFQVMADWARVRPRRVDWRPAARDVHAVLNGSNLWALDSFMGVLVATGADSALARPFLHGGGHAVLMLAGAQHPRFREPAHRLLRALSGQDYGADVARWRAWIASL